MEPRSGKRVKQRDHLAGGTLRIAMANEVKRVLATIQDQGVVGMTKAAETLGVSQRVLYKWCGPVEKGGWPELQVTMEDAMAKVSESSVKKSAPKKKVTAKKPAAKKSKSK